MYQQAGRVKKKGGQECCVLDGLHKILVLVRRTLDEPMTPVRSLGGGSTESSGWVHGDGSGQLRSGVLSRGGSPADQDLRAEIKLVELGELVAHAVHQRYS